MSLYALNIMKFISFTMYKMPTIEQKIYDDNSLLVSCSLDMNAEIVFVVRACF